MKAAVVVAVGDQNYNALRNVTIFGCWKLLPAGAVHAIVQICGIAELFHICQGLGERIAVTGRALPEPDFATESQERGAVHLGPQHMLHEELGCLSFADSGLLDGITDIEEDPDLQRQIVEAGEISYL